MIFLKKEDNSEINKIEKMCNTKNRQNKKLALQEN